MITPHRRRAWRITGLCATCLAVTLGTTSLWLYTSELAAEKQTQHQTYDRAVTRVELDLDDGAIRLAAGRPGQVVIERRLEWSTARPRIEETWDDDTLRIRSRCGEAVRCTVAYSLRVPADVEIDARAVVGPIEARGLSGGLHLTGSSDDVTLTDTTGPVRVTTSSGAITATGLRAGPVEIEADSGDVDLRFASPPRTITATTGPGNVDITVPGTDAYRVTVETSRGDSEVRVRQDSTAEHAITVRTTRGDVGIGYSW
jgi:hypothetical protein